MEVLIMPFVQQFSYLGPQIPAASELCNRIERIFREEHWQLGQNGYHDTWICPECCESGFSVREGTPLSELHDLYLKSMGNLIAVYQINFRPDECVCPDTASAFADHCFRYFSSKGFISVYEICLLPNGGITVEFFICLPEPGYFTAETEQGYLQNEACRVCSDPCPDSNL